jgi:hypothetical protein
MGISDVTWRTSTFSGANGGECIEVGVWRKATHSGADGGDCVEVATADTEVAVRDSKDPDGPALTFTASRWCDFVQRTVS